MSPRGELGEGEAPCRSSRPGMVGKVTLDGTRLLRRSLGFRKERRMSMSCFEN